MLVATATAAATTVGQTQKQSNLFQFRNSCVAVEQRVREWNGEFYLK